MKKISARTLTRGALIAAAYAVISAALAPISFGVVQLRAAEALTTLPTVMSGSVFGLTVGCLLSNLWGLVTGANILGAADLVLGTAATFLAAVCTRALRRRTVLACLPPIIINAVVIGGELTYLEAGSFPAALFAFNLAHIAAGEALCVFLLGLPLVKFINNAQKP